MSYDDYKKTALFFLMKIFVCYVSKVAKLSIGGIYHGAEGKYTRDKNLRPRNRVGVKHLS